MGRYPARQVPADRGLETGPPVPEIGPGTVPLHASRVVFRTLLRAGTPVDMTTARRVAILCAAALDWHAAPAPAPRRRRKVLAAARDCEALF
jgi:hypothetical protein